MKKLPSCADRTHDIVQRVLYRMGALMGCHQRTDRSLIFRGRQLPLCDRCFGILIGFILCPLFSLSLLSAGIGFSAFFIDGLTQMTGWRLSNRFLRLSTGFFFIPSALALLRIGVQKALWNM